MAALFSYETRGQFRTRKSRRDSFVLAETNGRISSVLFETEDSLCAIMLRVIYRACCVCSLSISLPVVDYFFLGSSSRDDKGKTPA